MKQWWIRLFVKVKVAVKALRWVRAQRIPPVNDPGSVVAVAEIEGGAGGALPGKVVGSENGGLEGKGGGSSATKDRVGGEDPENLPPYVPGSDAPINIERDPPVSGEEKKEGGSGGGGVVIPMPGDSIVKGKRSPALAAENRRMLLLAVRDLEAQAVTFAFLSRLALLKPTTLKEGRADV